jgi:hypothetical protein
VTRIPYTQQEQAAAAIPGIPGARIWADDPAVVTVRRSVVSRVTAKQPPMRGWSRPGVVLPTRKPSETSSSPLAQAPTRLSPAQRKSPAPGAGGAFFNFGHWRSAPLQSFISIKSPMGHAARLHPTHQGAETVAYRSGRSPHWLR